MMDLNKFQIPNDGNFPDELIDNSVDDASSGTSVYFRNIKSALIRQINDAQIVLGCVAWLTDAEILAALSRKEAVSLVVQKEDFLRPDLGDKSATFKNNLSLSYSKLKGGLSRFMFDNILEKVSICMGSEVDAVRCVGNHNRDKLPAFPRMHNKFLIFCRTKIDFVDMGGGRKESVTKVEPYAVWTGSFNMTKTAGKSLENAVLMKNPDVVRAYYKEYGQICAMSEPLNWQSDWIEPEWRIGT